MSDAPAASPAPAPAPPAPAKRTWWIIALPIAGALVAAALVTARMFIAASYRIPSASMIPTLATNAHVLVNKLDKTPQRGKMIVFRYPENTHQDFIKRIVGLPGDTIAFHGKDMSVNGKPVPSCLVGDFQYTAPEDGHAIRGKVYLETLDDTRFLVFHDANASPPPDNTWTVPADQVFVVGDNRENSHDSRSFFGGAGGGVPLGMIVGTVQGQARASDLPEGGENLKPALAACLEK